MNRTMPLALGLAMILLGAATPQDDECLLGLEAIRGQLDHMGDGVSTVEEPIRVGRRLSETIRLPDGTVVTFVIGGCAHYGYSFTYPGVDLADHGFAAASAVARNLLEGTPVRPEAASNIQLLVRALERPHDTPAAEGETYLECGDAVCSLRVAPNEDAGTVTLVVSYDFPL